VSGGALAALADVSPYLASRLVALERAAASEAPILVLGEPGTGRTTLARALHSASPRAGAPLVEVVPATLPATLIESELFGHRPGAFTGAERAQEGRVARAEGGTLLLDHVEELPLPSQPKLLRLLAERRYAPLGGAETTADVRFLSIGAQDLPARVERRAFRDDLYWRLEVLTFRLPPLRERRGDIPAAASALVADLALRFGRPGLRLAEPARAWFADHDWPGNLREMRNLLERELLAGDGETLDPSAPVPGYGAESRPKSLAQSEADAIRAALAFTRGHQGRAAELRAARRPPAPRRARPARAAPRAPPAELLGVCRKGLWEKRKRLGIP
jgi:NtrC-family two-component system response regulator AlgB